MHPLKMYYRAIDGIFKKILEEQETFDEVADLLAGHIIDDHVIFVFGTGAHSIMGAEEVFCRAGGLAPINAMLDPGLSFIHGYRRAGLTERTVGYARTALDFYGLQEDDIIIIVNVNGINAVTIDSALEARKRGATVIGVTSIAFSDSVPPDADSRHPSRKNLYELSDYVLDVHVPSGDAVLEIEGIPTRVSASSTVAITFTLNALMATVARRILELGEEPPILRSANLPGGLEYNNRLREYYRDRLKHYI